MSTLPRRPGDYMLLTRHLAGKNNLTVLRFQICQRVAPRTLQFGFLLHGAVAIFALNLNRLPFLGVNIAVAVQILLGVTIDASHSLIVVNIGLQVIVVLAVEFPLLAARTRPWSSVSITFHRTDKAYASSSATVMAVNTLGLRNL